MKFREHRGHLDESMETTVDLTDRDALVKHIAALLKPYGVDVSADKIKIEPYGFDDRIGWETYLVTMAGYGVLGFTNGPCEDNQKVC